MKRFITLGLLVTACYLFFLVQQCPVARVLPWLPLPPELTLSGARGTLWQGEFDQISWQGKVLQNVGWQLPVSSLLLFDPVVQLQFNDKETLRGQAELGWSGGVRLRDVDLQADAAWLLSQAPVRLPVTAAGQLHLQLTELRMTADRCQQLNGTLLWRGAEVQSPTQARRPPPPVWRPGANWRYTETIAAQHRFISLPRPPWSTASSQPS